VQFQTQIAARWPPLRFCSILSPVIALVFFKMHSPSGAYPSLESGSSKLPLLPFFLVHIFQSLKCYKIYTVFDCVWFGVCDRMPHISRSSIFLVSLK
jgi:hypothetical protein